MIIWSGIGIWGIAAPFALVCWIINADFFSSSQGLVLTLGAPILILVDIILTRIAIYSYVSFGGGESRVVKGIQHLGPMSLSFVDRPTVFFLPLIIWAPILFVIGLIFLITGFHLE